MIYHAVIGAGGVVGQVGIIFSTSGDPAALLTAMGATEITQAQYQAIQAAQYGATLVNGTVTAKVAPTPTLAQQAAALLAAGLTITSTGTPAINGTYGCKDSDQARFSRTFNLIQKAGGNAFPNGLASLAWPLRNGTPVTFTAVATFLAVEQAVGNFVLSCDQVMLTNSGALPSAFVTIS